MVRVRQNRAFTLIELMVVVAIVGVLATLAIAGLRRYVFSSKVVEATGMIQSIRVAEESWKSTHGAYLNVSGALTTRQPDSSPGTDRRTFYNTATGNLNTLWLALNPQVPGPVLFSYAVVAGLPGPDSPMVQPNLATPVNWPTPPDHWYVIEAFGDPDGDGAPTTCASSSISDEVVCEGE